MLTTNQKGAIAETAVVHAAVKLGIEVYRPLVEGGRYDLVFGLGHRLVRVQCKWASRRGDVIAIPCYSSRRGPSGFIKRPYTGEEVDAIAAYCPDLDRCYYLPVEQFGNRTYIQLRLAPARNGQITGIHWASDYQLESLDWAEHREGP